MTGIKARPTTYKGVKMRSRLEADYATMLDRMQVRWEYEPECFAGSGGQWLPDFGYSFTSDGPLMIFTEVKPAEPLAKQLPGSIGYVEYVDALLRRMAVAWESRPEVNLNLMFWQYNVGQYLSLYCARLGQTWRAEFGGQPMELMWTGMGQGRPCPRCNPKARAS